MLIYIITHVYAVYYGAKILILMQFTTVIDTIIIYLRLFIMVQRY